MSDKETAAINQAMLQLAAHIKKIKPYLFEVDKAISETEDGIVDIQVRVYHGSVTDVVVTRAKRFTFKQNK